MADQPPFRHLYELDLQTAHEKSAADEARKRGDDAGLVGAAGRAETFGAEVTGTHLWLVISGRSLWRDGIVIALPTSGQAIARTNFDVPYNYESDVLELRKPTLISLSGGECYVLCSKPRHLSRDRLGDPVGVVSKATIASVLRRHASALGCELKTWPRI